ncbi:MAG: hypothetical protein GW859_06850 [Sphingomonadales bacterium]|nr:hypothetical protein [Sphingomonadales bacterium]
MTRAFFPALAAASAAMLAFAIPATAAPGAYYHAELVQPVDSGRIVAKGLVWNCAGTSCLAANRSPSRAKIVCAAVAKQAGALASFTAGGEALNAEDLTACNAKAR